MTEIIVYTIVAICCLVPVFAVFYIPKEIKKKRKQIYNEVYEERLRKHRINYVSVSTAEASLKEALTGIDEEVEEKLKQYYPNLTHLPV